MRVAKARLLSLQTIVRLTAGDTVEVQGFVRFADGYFAAGHTSFRGAKIDLGRCAMEPH